MLLGEAVTVTTLVANFSCATFTFSQTAACEFSLLAASFKSFEPTLFAELLNEDESSSPRLFHRPDSTQNAAIGMRPDRGGTLQSIAIIRSSLPPRTTSPAWT